MKVLVQDGSQRGGRDFFCEEKRTCKTISILMFKSMSEMRKERRGENGKM